MSDPYEFYSEVLNQLLTQRLLSKESRILVVAAGMSDCNTLQRCGFTNATLSNLNGELEVAYDTTFPWSRQDAENLSYSDGEFDWVIEHNGIHHCASPHRAVLEMCRVAKRGIVFFEPYDNLVTRIGVRLGFGQEFEHAAVYYSGGSKLGGLRNTEIPNYVYRWTRREIQKTVASYEPYGPHQFQFIHRMRVPWGQLRGRRNKLPFLMVCAAWPLLRLIDWLAPSQANSFAAVVLKPDLRRDVYPWLTPSETDRPTINSRWLEARYGPLPPAH